MEWYVSGRMTPEMLTTGMDVPMYFLASYLNIKILLSPRNIY